MSKLFFENADQVRDLFFALLESMPTGILLVDREGTVQAANARAAELLGLVGTSLVERPCWDLLRQALRLSEDELVVLAAPAGRLEVSSDQDRLPGRQFRTMVIVRSNLKSPFAAVAGGFLLSLEDITYWNMVEIQSERQKRLAAMEEMAATMNQDLKNPLGSIELCASLLSRELADDPDNLRLSRQIERAVRTMDYLLHNYLIYAGLPKPDPKQLSLGEWLTWVESQWRLLDRDNRYSITILSHDLEETILTVDVEMFRLLAINAGVNAMESMPEGGSIELSVQRLVPGEGAQNCLELRFCDRGKGIAEDLLGRVFDPFFTTKNDAKGMGLSIIHYIIQAHHGLTRIENRPDGGACLVVVLPVESNF